MQLEESSHDLSTSNVVNAVKSYGELITCFASLEILFIIFYNAKFQLPFLAFLSSCSLRVVDVHGSLALMHI